jgi:preprotein translocase subunit SecF
MEDWGADRPLSELQVEVHRIVADRQVRMHQAAEENAAAVKVAQIQAEATKYQARMDMRRSRAMGGKTRSEVTYALIVAVGLILLVWGFLLRAIVNVGFESQNIQSCTHAGLQWKQNAGGHMECIGPVQPTG